MFWEPVQAKRDFNRKFHTMDVEEKNRPRNMSKSTWHENRTTERTETLKISSFIALALWQMYLLCVEDNLICFPIYFILFLAAYNNNNNAIFTHSTFHRCTKAQFHIYNCSEATFHFFIVDHCVVAFRFALEFHNIQFIFTNRIISMLLLLSDNFVDDMRWMTA